MNSLLLLLLSLAAAQDAAEPARGPSLSTAAVATAPLAAVPTGPMTAELAVERLRALDSRLTSLSARFRQSLRTEAGLSQEQTGRLLYKKPDGLRLEFESPRRQTAIADRKQVWIHQVDDKQIVRALWEDWKRGQSQMTGLLEFGEYGRLLKTHDAAVEPYAVEGSSPAWKVTLVPKDKAVRYTLVLVAAEPDFFPMRTELRLDGLEIVNRLSEVELNPALEDGLFKPDFPKDIPVLDFSNPLSP